MLEVEVHVKDEEDVRGDLITTLLHRPQSNFPFYVVVNSPTLLLY